ncbi:MAG: DUF3078 domain-containing protein [Ignavibacteria bacterium]|nr:DUF3078 domain-containing protein [Ignavibacteria bacterium]
MRIIKRVLFIGLLLSVLIYAQDQNSIQWGLHPNIGLTYTNHSEAVSKSENLEWLLSIIANCNYPGDNFQFDSDLFLQFGQIVSAGSHPQKTQDNFIMNLMPSVRLMESTGIRLFWQTKAETQLKKGYVGDQEAGFLDPLFLTHTLFVGNKDHLITQTGEQTFQIVYGIGYSFQQIIKKHYQLTSETQPNSSAEYIDGPTAVFNLTFSKIFNELVDASVSLNSLLLAKKDFFKSTSNSRFSSLLLINLNIGLFSIQYTNRLLYDEEISNKRSLDQSLVLGVKVDL